MGFAYLIKVGTKPEIRNQPNQKSGIRNHIRQELSSRFKIEQEIHLHRRFQKIKIHVLTEPEKESGTYQVIGEGENCVSGASDRTSGAEV